MSVNTLNLISFFNRVSLGCLTVLKQVNLKRISYPLNATDLVVKIILFYVEET